MEEQKKPIKINLISMVLVLLVLLLIIVILAVYVVKQNGIIRDLTNQNNLLSKASCNIASNIENIQDNSEFVTEYNNILKEKEEYDKAIDSKYGEGISDLYNIVNETYTAKNCVSKHDVKESYHMDEKVEYKDLSNIRKLLSIMNCSEKRAFKFPEDKYLIEELQKVDFNVLDYSDDNMQSAMIGDFGNSVIYSKIKETAQKVFEETSDISYDNIDNGFGGDFTFYENKYYYHGYQGGGMGVVDFGYSEIQKVEKDDDNIYIYDKCIYIDYAPLMGASSKDDGLIHFYSSLNYTNELGTAKELSDIGENLERIDEMATFKAIYNKYEKELTTYKHTFKKNESGDNYYWISSEPVK